MEFSPVTFGIRKGSNYIEKVTYATSIQQRRWVDRLKDITSDFH